ncbi:MAG: RidA family protein [Acidimicrobiales bacterium]
MERQRVQSGSPFEDRIGFCRAIRVGERVLVSGTAPVWPDGTVDQDPGAQTKRCFEIIGEALVSLGASLDDIVRTRMYICSAADSEPVSRAHGELFAERRPVATMVIVAGLLDPRWRVEIEAEAILGES